MGAGLVPENEHLGGNEKNPLSWNLREEIYGGSELPPIQSTVHDSVLDQMPLLDIEMDEIEEPEPPPIPLEALIRRRAPRIKLEKQVGRLNLPVVKKKSEKREDKEHRYFRTKVEKARVLAHFRKLTEQEFLSIFEKYRDEDVAAMRYVENLMNEDSLNKIDLSVDDMIKVKRQMLEFRKELDKSRPIRGASEDVQQNFMKKMIKIRFDGYELVDTPRILEGKYFYPVINIVLSFKDFHSLYRRSTNLMCENEQEEIESTIEHENTHALYRFLGMSKPNFILWNQCKNALEEGDFMRAIDLKFKHQLNSVHDEIMAFIANYGIDVEKIYSLLLGGYEIEGKILQNFVDDLNDALKNVSGIERTFYVEKYFEKYREYRKILTDGLRVAVKLLDNNIENARELLMIVPLHRWSDLEQYIKEDYPEIKSGLLDLKPFEGLLQGKTSVPEKNVGLPDSSVSIPVETEALYNIDVSNWQGKIVLRSNISGRILLTLVKAGKVILLLKEGHDPVELREGEVLQITKDLGLHSGLFDLKTLSLNLALPYFRVFLEDGKLFFQFVQKWIFRL
ncbi:hypothetical protein ACFL21_03155 [Patescibacteria group bacterium]